MKFLIIASPKDTVTTLPPSVLRQLLEATVDVLNQEKKAGRILELYSTTGGRAVTIGESKSAEELIKNTSGPPISGFYNFDIYPLADFNESVKITLENIKAAEKMMPPTK